MEGDNNEPTTNANDNSGGGDGKYQQEHHEGGDSIEHEVVKNKNSGNNAGGEVQAPIAEGNDIVLTPNATGNSVENEGVNQDGSHSGKSLKRGYWDTLTQFWYKQRYRVI